MQMREKILLCGAPYALAAALWFTVTSQAVTDWQAKDQELKDKAKEQVTMRAKIENLNKLKAAQKQLETEIDSLRSSVPKSADLDLLMIDLEKMCLESGLDLVSLEPPGKEKLKELQQAESESIGPNPKLGLGGLNKSAADKDKDKDKDDAAKKDDKKPKGKGKGKGKEKPPPKPMTPEEEAGLSTVIIEIKATGDYPALIELMKRLQAYQRVIAINSLDVNLPELTDKSKALAKIDPNKILGITFLLKTYYLP